MKLYQKMKTTGGYRLSLKMSAGLVRGTLDPVGGSGAVRKFKTIKIFAKIRENLKNFPKILNILKIGRPTKCFRPPTHNMHHNITHSTRYIIYIYVNIMQTPL